MNNTTGQTPGIANTASGAAIQRYKIGYHADEWGQRSSTPSGIPDASGSWVRYADHVTALAAAQAVVQDDLITIRKPTTSAELLWLLKLAHLVISDVDKTLEETFSPAQPAAQQGVAYADAHGAIMGAAYDFRDAHISGSPNQKRSAHAALESAVTHALRASHGQASSQAGEYPALVCDYCGALTPDPWHSSGMLHGKMSKHIHSCDACAARGAAEAQAAKQQEQLI